MPLHHWALILCYLACEWLLGAAGVQAQQVRSVQVTGRAAPGLSGFDGRMLDLMQRWHLPGGQLAIAKSGRLLLSRGYGYGDVERRQPVQPDSLFRIGSVSKTFTTVAILKLLESGHIH